MKKRLMEILSVPICPGIGADPAEVVADYLLDNGIIVPPCKVGDVVYEADGEHGVVMHNITEVHWVFDTLATDDAGNKWWDYYCDEDISEAHFTREAAEQVLKKGAEEQ